jgi:N-formylglutamate deformylase
MLEFQPVRVLSPTSNVSAAPLVLDSPHSGKNYPADFDHAVNFAHLRRAEDTDVDDLFGTAPSLGAAMVCAEFPRSYIDPNRRLEDIDPSMIMGRWLGKVDASPKTKSGIGLIWKVLDDGSPMYARALSVAEVQARIANCYAPYWDALIVQIENVFAMHGRVFHINCHSMPAAAGPISWVAPGTKFADVVLGNRDASTCAPEFTAMLLEAFQREGLSVAINDPYKGVELVKRFGRPNENRHSIQVEINRRLYMHEPTRERTADYPKLKALIGRVLQSVVAFSRT